MLKFFRIYGMSIVMSLFILYMSIVKELPDFYIPSFSFQDKVLHGGAYTVLTIILCYELFRQSFSFSSKQMIGWSIFYPILFGGLIEVVQQNFFPPRCGEWSDWLADIIGVLIGYFIAKYFVPKFFKPERGTFC